MNEGSDSSFVVPTLNYLSYYAKQPKEVDQIMLLLRRRRVIVR